MQREKAYVTSIPSEALEKVKAKQAEGRPKRSEYYLNGAKVGERSFHASGELEYEYAYRNGVKHGWEYHWYESGELLSAEPYENGVVHGTAYQWGRDGRLIGTYTLERGTGIDLWWQDWSDGSVSLSEVYYYQEGLRHGYEWRPHDEASLWHELHWQEGKLHGIERKWNGKGGLRRDYPRYWVQGEQVTKAKYLREAMKDPTLPPFQLEDNLPQRQFPPEIAQHFPK